MNEAIEESLSALLDGEADELETMRVLRALETDPELREKWRRYHMMVTLLRGEQKVSSRLDIGRKVTLSLAGESVAQRNRSEQKTRPWSKSVAILAVAASTTFIVVFGAQQWGRIDNSQNPATLAAQNATPTTSASTAPTHLQPTTTETALATDQERLERHMSRHAQGRLGSEPTLTQPFARPASLDQQ
ncbi:MAG: hypothetical protein IT471_04930 [Pseudomonadales bacterium]|nr:hypothetical protein [Pseudomonadales bacterium]MCC6529593.1 hypothetical protein [Pseudomonadales bacterium]MCP5332329.1 hypothetical protein [Pseudomonadales bacterium]HMU89754.1 RseA family anti-sigma factor [Pseudomonadales bacterium]HMW13971.1 RseA family anti-sigma factor [Pseudomonadales bacterium]